MRSGPASPQRDETVEEVCQSRGESRSPAICGCRYVSTSTPSSFQITQLVIDTLLPMRSSEEIQEVLLTVHQRDSENISSPRLHYIL
ncbi:hypothetical protein J6590_066633 [Homalodisca vitripennis]|nr:hypothetical protein J6590_066633 [Homalodisca vitripennis]